jgi:hypothetical protein
VIPACELLTEAVIVNPATLHPIAEVGAVIEHVGRTVSTASVVQEEAVQPLPDWVTVTQYVFAALVLNEDAVEELFVQLYDAIVAP